MQDGGTGNGHGRNRWDATGREDMVKEAEEWRLFMGIYSGLWWFMIYNDLYWF